jgi:hypothetical protein
MRIYCNRLLNLKINFYCWTWKCKLTSVFDAYNQGGYQGAANPDKSFSHGKKGSTVYKVPVPKLQLQGKFFGCSHRTFSETPSQVISVKQEVEEFLSLHHNF